MRLLGPAIVLSLAAALAGCVSVAYESDLVPGTTPAPAVGAAKFYIATPEDLRRDAMSARPNLFSEDLSAVPLVLKVDCENRSAEYTMSITVPTMEGDESLGSVAFKAQKLTNAICTEAVVKGLGQYDATKLQSLYDSRKSRVQSLSLDGKPCWGWVGYGRSKPGASNAWTENVEEAMARAAREKKYVLLEFTGSDLGGWCQKLDAEVFSQPAFQAEVAKRFVWLKLDIPMKRPISAEKKRQNAELMAKYLVKSLPTIVIADAAGKHVSSSDYRPGGPAAYLKHLDELFPNLSTPTEELLPSDVAVLYIYTTAPTYKTAPAQTVIVARLREDGRWRPCNGYLRKTQALTAATVLLENGKPGQAVLRQVDEPDIDDFIDLPLVAEDDRAASIRWSNGVLLQVMNRSIPRLVRERSGTELLDLATRIQKAALTLDEVRDKHNDRAQRLVEEGKGDPAPDREMAVLYRQRLEVLGAIRATIKQEAAGKKP